MQNSKQSLVKLKVKMYLIKFFRNITIHRILFLGLCEFHENYAIKGTHLRLDFANTKEECLQSVRSKEPNATGVDWFTDGKCFADFGTKLSAWSHGGRWACLFQGIACNGHINTS